MHSYERKHTILNNMKNCHRRGNLLCIDPKEKLFVEALSLYNMNMGRAWSALAGGGPWFGGTFLAKLMLLNSGTGN
jgi:hypothetical protein